MRPEAEYSDEDGEKIHRESVMSTDRNAHEKTREDTEEVREPQKQEEARPEESPNSLGAELVESGNNAEGHLGEKLENGLEFSGHHDRNEQNEAAHETLENSVTGQLTTESFVPEVNTQEVSLNEPYSEVAPAVSH